MRGEGEDFSLVLPSLISYSLATAVLPSLLPLVTNPDPSIRHGALHAVAEVTHALSKLAVSQGNTLTGYLGEETVQALRDLVPRVSVCVREGELDSTSLCLCP